MTKQTTLLFTMLITQLLFAQNVAEKIDNYLVSGSKHGFSGAMAVIKNGEVILNKGYGMANKKQEFLNTPNTIFDIGSNTKQFTATAILKLAEMGKLTLDDLLKRYFDNLPMDKQHITIHQLLSHTSGLKDAVGKDFDTTSQDEFFTMVFSSQLLSAPGSSYAYSNIGYSVLGRIIELASQDTYENFLKTYLFDPAGMEQTGYLLPKWDVSKISRSYNRGIMESESPIFKYQRNGTVSWHLKANGGINSTQNDLIRWYKALTSNTIISKESLEKLSTPYANYPNSTLRYGYGWMIRVVDNKIKRVSHNGSNGAYAHSLIWYPKHDSFISYATNANSEQVEFIAYKVAKMLMGETYTPNPIKNNVYAYAIGYMRKNNSNTSKELISLLKEQYPDHVTSSRLLNALGNILLMMNEHPDWSVALFKHNIELYPNDGNLWDSLGDSYIANNQKDKAIKSYQKAIALGYKGAQKKLTRLKTD